MGAASRPWFPSRRCAAARDATERKRFEQSLQQAIHARKLRGSISSTTDMKSILLLLLCGCVSEPKANTTAYQPAYSAQVAHKFERGACVDYAAELSRRLHKTGARNIRCITYRNSDTRGHMVVAWEDKGGAWIVSNEEVKPISVHGDTFEDRLQLYIRSTWQLGAYDVVVSAQ